MVRFALLSLLVGCAGGVAPAPVNDDPIGLSSKTKDDGGVNGAYDYCDGATACALGEGDCDVSAQCDAGLSCLDNKGTNWGLYWSTDVCAPATCANKKLDPGELKVDWGGSCGGQCAAAGGGAPVGYCHEGCECGIGGGDCNTDADCEAGLVCAQDVGTSWGKPWSWDHCVEDTCINGVLDAGELAIDFGGDCGDQCGGTNGLPEGYCKPGCECAVGEGDCDGAEDCEAGLDCIVEKGAQWGLLWSRDVCLDPHCGNGVQDEDETAIDFGGADCGDQCGGQNGDNEGYCTFGCTCEEGEGDCDSDLECTGDLRCTQWQGARFGMPAKWDVCLPVLHVADLADGDIYVAEILVDPGAVGDGLGEWFEVHNDSGHWVDLEGLVIKGKTAAETFTVVGTLEVENHRSVVFGKSADPNKNGGVGVDYVMPASVIFNNNDSLVLENAGAVVLDRVDWDNGAVWPIATGASMELDRVLYDPDLLVDNNVAANWCLGRNPDIMTAGDAGTPGYWNWDCLP